MEEQQSTYCEHTSIIVESFGLKHRKINHEVYDKIFNLQSMNVYNPYYVAGGRNGTDKSLQELIFSKSGTKECYEHVLSQVIALLKTTKKKQARIGVCCIGGKHRSVAFAERLCNDLRGAGYVSCLVRHLDIIN